MVVKIKANCLKLSESRIKQGLSTACLAEKAGVTRQTIYNTECGRNNPTPIIAKSIADALDVPFDDVFSLIEGE